MVFVSDFIVIKVKNNILGIAAYKGIWNTVHG